MILVRSPTCPTGRATRRATGCSAIPTRRFCNRARSMAADAGRGARDCLGANGTSARRASFGISAPAAARFRSRRLKSRPAGWVYAIEMGPGRSSVDLSQCGPVRRQESHARVGPGAGRLDRIARSRLRVVGGSGREISRLVDWPTAGFAPVGDWWPMSAASKTCRRCMKRCITIPTTCGFG